VFALIQKHLEGCTIHESLHLRWKDMAAWRCKAGQLLCAVKGMQQN
jgi:hypothetical protein